MKTIEVTVEVRRRYCEEIELTDEQYDAFMRGELDELQIPEIDFPGMFVECRTGDAWEETDYAICDENGVEIVPWDD